MPKKITTRPGERHYHTYQRMKTKSGRKDVYRCLHPECSHYSNKEMIDGKTARCFFCHALYQLSPKSLRLKTPHCGCRSLEDFQRVKLRQLSGEEIDQTALAMTILKSIGGSEDET
jgi:hypothetical protein